MQAETVVFQTATKPARNPLALSHRKNEIHHIYSIFDRKFIFSKQHDIGHAHFKRQFV